MYFWEKRGFFSTNMILLLIWVNCCAHFRSLVIRQRVKGLIPREEKTLFPEKQVCFSMSTTSQHPMQCSVVVARLIMDFNGEQETKEGVWGKMTSSPCSSYIAVSHKKIEATDRTAEKIICIKVPLAEERKGKMRKGSLFIWKVTRAGLSFHLFQPVCLFKPHTFQSFYSSSLSLG